jgi:NAD(P)-dependent dehydrogenase (short-subunit alcohol dehydrogenase family)
MSLVFGRELGKYGVTTNVIAPRARTPMTQHTASMAAPEDPDAFDTYAPANVSPFVVWLCTDDAADVTGQTFIVGGSGVWRMQPFSHLASLELTGKRLTVADISARRDELFADVDPGLPPFQAPKFG